MASIDAPGKLIAGKYELLSPAGEGGMAVVWKAIARGAGSFAKQVAVKRIQAGKTADPSFIKMFEEEARVGSQLEHPNIVHIMDFGREDDGGYYLVMEWCEGLDMFQWVRSFHRAVRPTPWALVSAIGIEVLRGLAAAHERVGPDGAPAPVYHRDVSPSNILLGSNGTVKLTDFGLARAMDRASMTRPNVIKGKLAYCAPELITGAKAGPRSDIFALGVVLWEAVAQRRLFTGKNDLEVLLAVRKGDVPPLKEERPDIPATLHEVIHNSLAQNPDERFQNCKEMARALASVLRASTEQADSEPLGASVRAARVRLGKDAVDPSAGAIAARANLGQPNVTGTMPSPSDVPMPDIQIDMSGDRSSEDLSISDVEIVEAELTQRKSKTAPAPEPEAEAKPAMKGLWKNEGPSVAMPLTTTKKK
jgi:serine/threonine protein kinase